MMDRVFTALHLLLLSLISAASVDLLYQGVVSVVEVPESHQDRGGVVVAGSRSGGADKPLSLYDVVVSRNLFDLVDPSKQVKAEMETLDVESLAETRLRLKLWGTISGGEVASWAIIEDEVKRKQDLYKMGDSVQSAVIKMVLRDRVVVSYKGRDEVLMMEKDKGAGGGRASKIGARRSESYTDSAVTKKVNLKRETINDAMMNINSLMKDVRIRPHFRNGQPEGMAVSGIKSNSIFRKMGIRNGDIITGVDGQKIESVDDAMALYGNLKSTSEIQLEIKRMGQVQSIEYTIE